jgi:hypothetical protein
MPLDYGASDRMRDAIRQMRARAINDKVGLVMRWNKRDDMIWTIYSEFLNQVDPLNIPPQERARFERRDGDHQEENERFRPSATPTAPIGCHAEEIMIVNWVHYELEAVAVILAQAIGRAEPAPWANVRLRTERFVLREVDLVLSKSPCHGPGGSQPLRSAGNDYGTGCSMKLWRFCSLPKFSNVRWRIFYCALPPERMVTRFTPRTMPGNLDRKQQRQWPSQESQRLVQLNRQFVPVVRSDVGPLVTATPPVDAFGRARASLEGHLRLRSPFAGLVSLGLRGISKLNSLTNVTCEPL